MLNKYDLGALSHNFFGVRQSGESRRDSDGCSSRANVFKKAYFINYNTTDLRYDDCVYVRQRRIFAAYNVYFFLTRTHEQVFVHTRVCLAVVIASSVYPIDSIMFMLHDYICKFDGSILAIEIFYITKICPKTPPTQLAA